MPLGRTDSDLDDVWSDESGELDRGAELTEFDFNPPQKKEKPKPRPPLTSDLEAPALGVLPDPVPAPAKGKAPTLEIGAVLVGSSSTSLLTDPRPEKPPPVPKSGPSTIIADAESAAIAHVVSRSLTNERDKVSVPAILERDDVSKVLMGKRSEEEALPPLVLAADDAPPPLEAPDAPLELAYDPHDRTASPPPPRPVAALPRQRESGFSMKRIVLGMLAIVIIAYVVRLFVHS